MFVVIADTSCFLDVEEDVGDSIALTRKTHESKDVIFRTEYLG